MRPQQQNRRMRGRSGSSNNNNNNNRRGPNPLTRSYESNGPDVKIRGTAQQIADKYTTLARDAQSSGDRVIAENYLQHAEHYNRIIATALAQQQQQQQQQNVRDSRDDGDDDMDDREEFDAAPDRGERNERHDRGERQDRERNVGPANDGSGPQPVIEGVPAEIALKDEELRRKATTNGQPHRNGSGAASVNGAEPQSEHPEGEAAQAEAGAAEDGAPKRPRRPRRAAPRVRAKAEDAGEGEAPLQSEQETVQS